MASPRPTPAPAVWMGAAPVLPAADAEVAEALPEGVMEAVPDTCVTEELPAEGVALPDGAALADGVALPDAVALPDGQEGWVLTSMF